MNALTIFNQSNTSTELAIPKGIMPAQTQANEFAPDVDLLKTLLAQSKSYRDLILALPDALFNDGFLRTMCGLNQELVNTYAHETGALLFREFISGPQHAITHLNQYFWSRLLKESRFAMVMPPSKKSKFLAQPMGEYPEFTPDEVSEVITYLLSQQDLFFAERVQYVFDALSDSHVTNSQSGFSSKMIVDASLSVNAFAELRMIAACLLGRASRIEAIECGCGSAALIEHFRSHGPYNTDIDIDNGLMTIRVFKKGTVHVWIEQGLANRLNAILNALHPTALPKAVKKTSSTWAPKTAFEKCIPMHALSAIIGAFLKGVLLSCSNPELYHKLKPVFDDAGWSHSRSAVCYSVRITNPDPVIEHHLALLGGFKLNRKDTDGRDVWYFNYDVKKMGIYLSQYGAYADRDEFQFFPTKGRMSMIVADMVERDHVPGLTYLEPSIGHADLISAMTFVPPSSVTGVELSKINAHISSLKGYNVVQGDFLVWAREGQQTFDRVVMNPPYTSGQAWAHLNAALGKLAKGGRLYAVLPASLYNDVDRVGCIEKSEKFSGMFDDASVTVFVAVFSC